MKVKFFKHNGSLKKTLTKKLKNFADKCWGLTKCFFILFVTMLQRGKIGKSHSPKGNVAAKNSYATLI